MNNGGASLGSLVPVYNTPCHNGRVRLINKAQHKAQKIVIALFQVCRNGQCVHRAVQIINQESLKCMHAKLSTIVTMSNCREGTYQIQRFTLLQRNGTHQYYIVRGGTSELGLEDYCMAVDLRKDAYLHMNPCSWENESFLWTLNKTAKGDALEYTIFNEKHRLYLAALDFRIHLSPTQDPNFSSNFVWQLFEMEAQEPEVQLDQSEENKWLLGRMNTRSAVISKSFHF